MRKYTTHLTRVESPVTAVTGSDLHTQLLRMKNTAAGFDGVDRPFLLALHSDLWTRRAEVENMGLHMGLLPSAYGHVIAPMLPKGHAQYAEQHRGLAIFSMLHRLHYGVQWNRLKEWQESWICNSQHGGRSKGEYAADAWDLQASIENA